MPAQHPCNIDIATRQGQEILSLWSEAKLAVGQTAWIMKMTQQEFFVRRKGELDLRLKSFLLPNTLTLMRGCSRWQERGAGDRLVGFRLRQPPRLFMTSYGAGQWASSRRKLPKG